jgi:hypothetical protein
VKVAEKNFEVFPIIGSRNVMGIYFASKSKELATCGYSFDEESISPNTFVAWSLANYYFDTEKGSLL